MNRAVLRRSFEPNAACVANSPVFRSAALEAETLPPRAVVTRVFNQSNPFFPNNVCEMTGGMIRVENTQIALDINCRFPWPLLVLEAAGGDSVNVVRLEFGGLSIAEIFLAAASLSSSFSRTIRSSVTMK